MEGLAASGKVRCVSGTLAMVCDMGPVGMGHASSGGQRVLDGAGPGGADGQGCRVAVPWYGSSAVWPLPW